MEKIKDLGSYWSVVVFGLGTLHAIVKLFRKKKRSQPILTQGEFMGIDHLKEVVVAAGQIFNAVVQAEKNDGKIDLADLPLVIGVLPALAAAFKDVGQVIPEAKDLSSDELAQLVALAGGELGGLDDKTQLKIEKVLMALKANYEAVKAFV